MKNAFQLSTLCVVSSYINNDNDQNKVGLKSHTDVYRVRRRPAYSSVTSFLILAKQGAAALFDLVSLVIFLNIEFRKISELLF